MAKKRTKKIDSTSSRTFHRHATLSRRSDTGLENVRTQGAILPIELLVLGAGADARLEGLRPEDFHLSGGQRLNEKITECWEKLQRCWSIFQDKRGRLDEDDYGTTLTRNEWLLPLFGALDYGRLERNRPAPEVNGKRYAISHRAAEPVAIHLVSFRQRLDSPDTDKRAGARVSPHSLVQEFLNESDAYLYGFVSNGLKFRILRDNASLVRPAYIEFDLETIMETKAFGEFYLFFLLTHQSRVENRFSPVEDEVPAASEEEEESVAPEPIPETDCWLEVWHRTAKETGVRALDLLREEVQKAINKLGAGFLAHPKNTKLHQDLKEGVIGPQDYYRLLLRLVYRLIFLLILEDRDLLFLPSASQEQKDRYTKYYSLSRIRSLARRGRGGRHGDLWKQLRIIFDRLGAGESRLGIPAFGSLFFRRDFIADLNDCEIANIDLLAAVRSLSYTTKNNLLQPINYRNIGTEELGSIYESLLEMHPTIRGHLFRLDFVAGNERKTSGSYYTPPELVDSLLNTALNPVIAAALEGKGTKEEKEKALLALRVCDPACGSGHFLIGAAHRLGKRLAQIRTGDEEPAPDHYQSAVRDVIAHSIYGVDLNPMAVELCKISLWIESTKPGKGLLFLDHRIKCGNSLLGATPELLNEGIPDAAFMPIEGDDKAYCAEFKKKNQSERKGETFFDFDAEESDAASLAALGTGALTLANLPDETAREYDAKETALREYVESTAFQREKLKADLWAASFVWKKTGEFRYPITQNILKGVDTDGPSFLEPWMKKELDRLTETYRFFHWHLEFADVFGTEGDGGFDVVIGNPPWEQVQFDDREYFAKIAPNIANAQNMAKRKALLEELENEDPFTYRQYKNDLEVTKQVQHFVHDSGYYRYCCFGRLNTAPLFAELTLRLVGKSGRIGLIIPSGIASNSFTQYFFRHISENQKIASLYDFENRKKFFPAVLSLMKFTLLTMTGEDTPVTGGADLSFFNQSVHDLNSPERRFKLTPAEIKMINPNTRTCPIFRNVKDATLTKAIYRRVPILIREEIKEDRQGEKNPWNIQFQLMFMMNTASYLFRGHDELESEGYRLEGNRFVKQGAESFLPLYEAKMIHQFNHRFGDYRDLPADSKSTQLPAIPTERLRDSDYLPLPRYWVSETEVRKKVAGETEYLMGWRDIARTTDVRTVISSVIPVAAVGHTLPLYYLGGETKRGICFCVMLDTFCLDFVARQKVGGTHLTFNYLTQFPLLSPTSFSDEIISFILPRALELIYTATDLAPFAKDCGYVDSRGDVLPPLVWNEERRFLLRCELDALFFGLYFGFEKWTDATEHPEAPEQLAELTRYFPTPLDALDYVMGTFPIVKRKDLADPEHDRTMREYFPELKTVDLTQDDSYPTHAVIRTIFRRMTDAIAAGTPYPPLLDLPKLTVPEGD